MSPLVVRFQLWIRSAFRRFLDLRLAVLFVFSLACACAGCELAPESETATLPVDDSEFLMMVVVDLSGSFTDLMAEQGKAYDFAMQVIDRYFRDRIGTKDRLILAQISGTDRTLLWEGEPLALRQEYPTADSFRQFLLQKKDPNGSRVHDGLAHAVEYLCAQPNISNRKAKSAIFVLSDMLDNAPNPKESERRLVTAFEDYGHLGGVVGMYYVDQLLVTTWSRHLKGAQLREFCLESEIVGNPRLPYCR